MARKNTSKIQVLLRKQPADASSLHQSSRIFADLLVSCMTAKWEDPTTKKRLRILTNESWHEVKTRFRGVASSLIPALLPPGRPETLMLSYPPHNFESNGVAKQKALWLGATRF